MNFTYRISRELGDGVRDAPHVGDQTFSNDRGDTRIVSVVGYEPYAQPLIEADGPGMRTWIGDYVVTAERYPPRHATPDP